MLGLIDSTLREGGQQVGVAFSPAAKIAILRRLTRLGIEEAELGVVGGDNRDLEQLLRAARRIPGVCCLALWCRCLPADVATAIALHPDRLSLSIPTSELHLQRKFGRPRSWAMEAMTAAIAQARAGGLEYISVGFEDASRAESDFLLELATAAWAAGASRIRLADTVGIATPALIAALVTKMRQVEKLELGVHTHNDFGMATANAIAALAAGAAWADVTVLGLGERAGNAKLEEVVGYLTLVAKEKSYRIEELSPICQAVARLAGVRISSRQPVVGKAIFACESGLHLQGLLREPATYEPYAPARVGLERKLLFGAKIGRRAVADFLATVGLDLEGSHLDRLVTVVRRLAAHGAPPLTAYELITLARTP